MTISHVECMDCMEAMRKMPDKSVDLCIADPPYGIGITSRHRSQSVNVERERERTVPLVGGSGRPFGDKGSASIWGKHKSLSESKFYPVFDDSSPPDAEVFRELERISKSLIIWGGNFFLEHLGPASCMIVWDKKRRGLDQADCEIAWTNLKGQSRIFEYRWNGMLQENMKEKEVRIHATQKPTDLYTYCYQLAGLKEGDTVLDPFLGSGSSRIAAYNMGLNFVGYEINETYFRLQEERFARHTAQMSLFVNEEEL